MLMQNSIKETKVNSNYIYNIILIKLNFMGAAFLSLKAKVSKLLM